MRSVLSRVFRYAIATARADRDAAADLRGAPITPKLRHLAAITTPKEAGRLMRAIDAHSGHSVMALALRITQHLFVRRGKLRTAEWTEIDLDAAIWSTPAATTTMRRQHHVPLSTQVNDPVKILHPLAEHNKYLFLSIRTPRQFMSENTIIVALRRMGEGFAAEVWQRRRPAPLFGQRQASIKAPLAV